ncbi:hypothetical protein H9X85_08135 [Anaerotignum lactatifermentans]|uniref:Copper amine oxidase-like N-terminal domain-containing protein n=1 Tax=Anaerotignum lactatifermentans TaxID=160404 RepID=A0ABS2GBK7_9FIRM|nr:hypothetical protein [Anaerotignum lactatifermentans]MBM6829498.1 hypothetical protein [Anaerotignum lactatifermentans]MBM6877992.1 hypothetical protein [Anaerotignum lactatifermentans]MBM6951177.1 hypothetical protein [Anaerotignum lactatifermentans]
MKRKIAAFFCSTFLLLGNTVPALAAETLVSLPKEHMVSIAGHPVSVFFLADVYDDPVYGPQCNYSLGDCFLPAADLRQYGFEVLWHPEERCATIAPKADFKDTIFPENSADHPASYVPAATDMKAYGGHEKSFPLRSLYSDGKLFVNLYDVFSKFGTVTMEQTQQNNVWINKVDFQIQSAVPAVDGQNGIFLPLKEAFPVTSLYQGTLVSKAWTRPTDTEADAPVVPFYDLSIFHPETETSQNQSYIGYTPALFRQMGLAVKTEGSLTSMAFAGEPKSTAFTDYEVYVMSEPTDIYNVDLSLTDKNGNMITAEGPYPVFLSIKGSLCIRTDILAQTLGLDVDHYGYAYTLPR